MSEEPGAAAGSRLTLLVLGALALAYVSIACLHGSPTLSTGNSEWDYVSAPMTRFDGSLERSASLTQALRPDPLYGQGLPLLAAGVRAGSGALGADPGAFRGAQVVAVLATFACLFGALRLARALGVPGDFAFAAPAGLACYWTFTNLAVQPATDLLNAACTTFGYLAVIRGRPAVAGLLLGLSILVRGNNPPLLLVGSAAVFVEAWPRVRTAAWRPVGVFAMAFALGAAPRIGLDLWHAGAPIYHQQGPILRAVLLEGGLHRYRPEPVSVLEVVAAAPVTFAASFVTVYARHLLRLAPALLAALVLLRRTAAAWPAAAILLLGPITNSAHPDANPRYVLHVVPLAMAACVAAIVALTPAARRAWLRRAVLGAFAVLFATSVGLLIDKYRFDAPIHELRAALAKAEASLAPRDGSPPVLVRVGVQPEDAWDVCHVSFLWPELAPRLVGLGQPISRESLPFLAPRGAILLRVETSDTGPSALWRHLRGRPRERVVPARDPAAEVVGMVTFHARLEPSGVEVIALRGSGMEAQDAVPGDRR